MEFSNRLLAARKEKGYSQELLADELGVSRQAVSKWETGEAKPDLDNLLCLCTALDISMEYLCFGKSEAEQPTVETGHYCKKHIAIFAILAAVCLLIGVFIGYAVFHDTAAPAQAVDYGALIASVDVANATVIYDSENGGYKISLLPSAAMTDETPLAVEYIVENLNFPSQKPITVVCEKEDMYYTGIIYAKQENCEYLITARLYINQHQKHIPLMKLSPAGTAFGYTWLWK